MGYLKHKVESAKWLHKTFFTQRLLLNIAIKVAHRMGQGTNRAMVVQLENYEEKGKIFKNLYKLKGVKNEDGKFYFVNDQLPSELQEEQR